MTINVYILSMQWPIYCIMYLLSMSRNTFYYYLLLYKWKLFYGNLIVKQDLPHHFSTLLLYFVTNNRNLIFLIWDRRTSVKFIRYIIGTCTIMVKTLLSLWDTASNKQCLFLKFIRGSYMSAEIDHRIVNLLPICMYPNLLLMIILSSAFDSIHSSVIMTVLWFFFFFTSCYA